MSKEVKFERLVIGSDIFTYGDVLLSAIGKYLNPDISIERNGFVFTHYNKDETIIFDYSGTSVHEKCRKNLERFKYVYEYVEDFVKDFSDLIFPENTDYHIKKFEDMFFKNNDVLITIVRNANKLAGETYQENDAHFNEIVDVFVTFIKNLVRQANADDKSYEVWLKAINESKDGIILLPDIFYRLPGRLDLRLLDGIYFVIVNKTVKDGVLKDDERALMPLCSFYHDEPEEKIIRITKEIENEPGCMDFYEGVAQFNTEENARNAALKLIEKAFSKEKKIPTLWSKYNTVVIKPGGYDCEDVLFVAIAKYLNPDIKVLRLDNVFNNLESPGTTLIYNRDDYYATNEYCERWINNNWVYGKCRVFENVTDFLDECGYYIFPYYTKLCNDRLITSLYFEYSHLISRKEENIKHFDTSVELVLNLIKDIQINADFMQRERNTLFQK